MCPISNTQNAGNGVLDGNDYYFNCPKCGNYKISYEAGSEIISKILISTKLKVSSWICEQNKVYNEQMPYIDSKRLNSIIKQKEKTIREKFNYLMKALPKLESKSMVELSIQMFNECYIKDQKELVQLIIKAQDEGLIYDCINNSQTRMGIETGTYTLYYKGLTFEGEEYLESLVSANTNSNKIFMAFWFDPEIQKIFDDIVKPEIDNAGFLAERVSSSTTNLENKISDEIIGMIKSSRAIIADCTGNRTAVYYEAGYAMGMKIPVVWTCKEDQVKNICFDVNQHPFILWNTPEELADKVVKRLKAIL
jgi:hypothetical protein